MSMRILYITNDFPYPLTSGHLRHYFLVRELARRHQVTLLSIVRPSFTPEHEAALAPYTERIMTFVSSTQGRSQGEKVRNQVAAALARRPLDEASLRLAVAAGALRQAGRFDAAVISGRRTLPVLEALHDTPVVADLCDADSVRLRGNMRRASPLALPRLALEYRRTVRAERALLHRADHLLFASARDLQALLPRERQHATVVPNGVDADYWQRSAPPGRNTLIFTGAMQYPPNADAALRLIEQVLPLVRRERPDARLLIVGRDPPAALVRAGERDGVTVTGSVPDVRPWLEQATIFAAPLSFGAGIQNKVLEALAMELPVVASPLAAEGLRRDGIPTPPLTVAAAPADMAREAVRLLAEADVAPKPFTAGREYVTNYYGWQSSGETLEAVLQEVAAAGRRGTGAALAS